MDNFSAQEVFNFATLLAIAKLLDKAVFVNFTSIPMKLKGLWQPN